jgi:DNA-binding NarL/FixJ family response regulator
MSLSWAQEARVSLPQTRQRSERAIRIAIVDDHRLLLDSLAMRLHDPKSGINVVTTQTTWSGLLSHPEFPVDVVVLDLQLEDGVPISTKIRALGTAGTGAVVMSTHAHTTAVRAALNAGALGFVPKTDSVTELVTAIKAAAIGGPHLSEKLAAALADQSTSPDPGLGRQELRAIFLYAGGRSLKEVAREMSTTEETVKSYIKRGRRKYRAVGIDVGTRILLRRFAVKEGWLPPE